MQNNAVASYEITAKLFDQFVAYTGNATRTGAPPTIQQTSQMPQWPVAGPVLLLSEGWGAFTNQQGFGFAAYSPQGFPYSAPNQATSDPTDQELGFSFFSPFSFTPGSTVQFDTFLMQGNYTTMQWETYDVNRRLGPFVDISPPLGDINSTPLSGSTVRGRRGVSACPTPLSTTASILQSGWDDNVQSKRKFRTNELRDRIQYWNCTGGVRALRRPRGGVRSRTQSIPGPTLFQHRLHDHEKYEASWLGKRRVGYRFSILQLLQPSEFHLSV